MRHVLTVNSDKIRLYKIFVLEQSMRDLGMFLLFGSKDLVVDGGLQNDSQLLTTIVSNIV
jgi:hypothetical protein